MGLVNPVNPVNPAHELPTIIRDALEEGRYRPGRGPWYCSRILPVTVPVSRRELLNSGMTRRTVEKTYDQVAYGIMLPKPTADSSSGEDCGAYTHCIIGRSRAHQKKNPGCILGGWGAAGFHGLKFWADAAPVLLLSNTLPPRGSADRDTAAATPLSAAVRALPRGFDVDRDTVTPDPAFPEHRVVSVSIALAQCLRSVLSGTHHWYVVDIPGLTRREVRAIQLLDAFAQCTHITKVQIREVCRGVVAARTVRKLLRLAASGSESPRETELRLFVRDMLPAGHQWETQVGVTYEEETSWGGTKQRRTFLDIACPTLRVGLYYDGKHHEDDAQTDKDFEQLQDLRDGQWTVVRINRKLMANPRKMLTQIRRAIERAVREAAVREAAVREAAQKE
ncbi:hypothetical protein [Corynebacterium terpenotabidum]|uniref:DUF559 domain-containing protein n=1 Tax=Corynebacterium terpenotabidum Y-11 TaxID=1200352 RepID=S4XEM1_9CORY|nr:hypothetical protein [Corynebacterium terpenotabidum]AGP30976.1 hypothetical protein A606_06645 [Corynebacterium terpenotabidum Y-11]